MPKGHTNNPKGRPKGSRNKKRRSIDREEYREVMHDVTLDSLREIKDLELKDRLNVLPKFLSFVMPRLNGVDGLKEQQEERMEQKLMDEAMRETLNETLTEEMKQRVQLTYLGKLEEKLKRVGRKGKGGE